jgi:hypothetical protein
MHSLAITSLLVISLTSCAKLSREETRYPAPIHWDTKNFRVHFRAGPRGSDGKSFSFYEITHKSPDGYGDGTVMESAHSLHGFQGVTNGIPTNWIRIIEDPNGKALLIEEDIPNDCGPCMNYLWVNLDGNFLVGTYFRLPSKTTGDGGGIDYEYPKVISLEGDLLKYKYSIGNVISKSVQSIEKADRPTPPG